MVIEVSVKMAIQIDWPGFLMINFYLKYEKITFLLKILHFSGFACFFWTTNAICNNFYFKHARKKHFETELYPRVAKMTKYGQNHEITLFSIYEATETLKL